jgi:hypothetical protein
MEQRIERIKLWFKAFIPRELTSAEVVPAGPHAGKTMLPNPGPVKMYFLTDQRSFDSDIDAHARMHSEIEIDVLDPHVVYQHHKCFSTIQVDPETGEEKCHQPATTDDMKFTHFRVAENGRTFLIDLEGSSKNPCVEVAHLKLSPNVDYSGTIAIQLLEQGIRAFIWFKGKIETYPCFELYASINNGPPQTIFQEPIAEGASILNITGPATREITYRVEVSPVLI